MLSIRIVSVDHYMSKPIVGLRAESKTGKSPNLLPVLRIFGPDNFGKQLQFLFNEMVTGCFKLDKNLVPKYISKATTGRYAQLHNKK